MKVAVCISGEMRMFENEYISNSLHYLYKLNPDIFVSTWSHKGFSYNVNRDSHILSERNDFDFELVDKIKNYYKNLKSFEVENYNDWLNNLSPEIKHIMSGKLIGGEAVTSPPQLYKIYMCNELKKRHELKCGFKYDVVIRTRPDVVYLNDIDFNNIDSLNNINFGIPGAYWANRIFDIFFYSTSENMDKVCNTWNNLIDNINDSFENGLDKRDCCRLLYVSAMKNSISVNDLQQRTCEVYRNESHEEFMNRIKWLNGL